MKYLLALDQGTTSSRALVIDYSGKVIAVAQKEFTQFFPEPGRVEHDANEIWASQIGVAGDALGRAGISHKDIAAIGITNQRETAVVWDRKTGEPVGHAIVWQDRRTAPTCDQMRADGLVPLIQKKTGFDIHTITEGVPAKGMIAWKAQLPAGQILALAAYVGTLHGSNPPNPKAPQGELAKPESAK
jgi:glycerol kinase